MANIKRYLFLIFFVWITIFFSGCFHEEAVTKQEASDFAKTLEASIAARNPEVFNNILDAETFKKRIKAESHNTLSDNLLSEIPSALKNKKLGEEVLKTIGKDGMYQFVKIYEVNKKQHLIFRLFGGEALNYHDIELIHVGKEIKAADIYVYLTGENLSKSLADIYLQLGDYYDKRAGEKDFVQSISGIKKLIAQEKYAEALAMFQSLPDTLQKQKLFQLIHIQITGKMENDVYKKALEEYQKLFPHEPGMYLLFLDVYFVHEEYDKALEDVNKMDSLINKDPFLDYYRGLIYKVMKNDSTAEVYFERLYKTMPNFGNGLIELIGINARKNEMKKANELVQIYKNNKKLNQKTLDVMYVLYPGLGKE